jgi:LysR family hydrogen peroxide-inducible transcriptional activator
VNLSDLRYLVAVADQRHFGRAAEACFVSQPTLSTQIKKLERELGVELLERHPRQVLLTAAGARVVEHARRAVAEADTIVTIAKQAADPEAGSVRIGLFPTLGPYLLPHVVPAVHRRFPRLELLLVEDKTAAVLEQLRDGRLDAGVLAQPVDEPHLHESVLFHERFVLAVPADHRLARARGKVDLDVLDGEQVLLLQDGHCLREQALSVCQVAGAGERAGFRATSLETLRQMVAAGVGITLLPELSVAPPVPPNPAIKLLRFREPVPGRTIALYVRRTSPYLDLLDTIAELVRSTPLPLGR